MPSPPLHGTVLVTGASSGIGLELARQLAPRAQQLILVARRADRLEALASELRARHHGLVVEVQPCDLAVMDSVDALLEGVAPHGVDVLINNAGMGDLGLFEVADPAKLHQMLMVNVVGLTRLTRGLVPGMVQRGRGGILNISSGYGLTWTPAAAAYIGTKHYVTGFTESLRSELRPAGITVTQACPGPVATEFEAVAGNPFGQEVPAFVELSAEQCAAEALAGFDRDRAIVVPGMVIRIAMWLAALAPRGLLRLMYAPASKQMRRSLRTADDGA